MNIKFPNNILYPSSSKQPLKAGYQVGNVYLAERVCNTQEYYVLANVNSERVALICLSDNNANRWTEPVKVKDRYNLSQKETDRILGLLGQAKFTYVGRLEDVVKIIPDPQLGHWCNGSTVDSKPTSQGSNPWWPVLI